MMLKILFCCFMKSAAEPIQLDIIELPTQPRLTYRPDSVIPFTEKDKEYFSKLRRFHFPEAKN